MHFADATVSLPCFSCLIQLRLRQRLGPAAVAITKTGHHDHRHYFHRQAAWHCHRYHAAPPASSITYKASGTVSASATGSIQTGRRLRLRVASLIQIPRTTAPPTPIPCEIVARRRPSSGSSPKVRPRDECPSQQMLTHSHSIVLGGLVEIS
jgi:hypothetical protein